MASTIADAPTPSRHQANSPFRLLHGDVLLAPDLGLSPIASALEPVKILLPLEAMSRLRPPCTPSAESTPNVRHPLSFTVPHGQASPMPLAPTRARRPVSLLEALTPTKTPTPQRTMGGSPYTPM